MCLHFRFIELISLEEKILLFLVAIKAVYIRALFSLMKISENFAISVVQIASIKVEIK